MSIREAFTNALPLRVRMWLKTSAGAFAECLRRPSRERWGEFCRRLALHPWSVRITGDSPGRPSWPPAGRDGEPFKLTIFLAPCCWGSFLPPFVQLGDALRRRGMAVTYVSGHAGFCSYLGTMEGWTEARCPEQLKIIDRKFLGASGPLQSLGSSVPPEVRRRAEEWFDAHGNVPVLELSYGGWQLWEMVKGSYGRLRLERINPKPEETADELPGLEDLLKGFVIAYETVSRYLEAARPDAVMVFNGLFYQERIISELARAMGIRVVAQENSNFADRKIFDRTGYIGNYTSVAAASWPTVRGQVLSEQQRQRLAAYLDGVYRGAHNTIGQARSADAAWVRAQLRLAPEQRIALLLGQVPFDTVIIYDLRIFDSILAFMGRTIEIFREMPQYTLVVRMHPWESEKFGDRTYHQLQALNPPANVRFVRGRELNTYDLMRLADFGITATSQAGLELLSMAKPLIVTGDAFYARKGFTCDVPSAGLLEAAIREVAARPVLTDEQRGLVERFLYHVIFEHQVPYDRENAFFPPEAIDRIEALLHS